MPKIQTREGTENENEGNDVQGTDCTRQNRKKTSSMVWICQKNEEQMAEESSGMDIIRTKEERTTEDDIKEAIDARNLQEETTD